MNRRIALALALFVAATGLGIAVARDVLNPQFTPEKGSYDKPEAKIGAASDHPWSVTTVAASVNGKPLPGKVTSVVGEIVDYSCYLQVGKHGGKHRDCGQKCLRNGQPIGLLTKEGKLYLLMEEEHDPRRDATTTFRQAAIDNMAYIVEVTGTLSEVDGQRALYVSGFLKK
ncbi:MAG TPA: hypothetical protein VN641_09600 [Urbifossiella sp.]|nr:hypothetical protein [Urbifossiella sp.]